MVADVLVPWTQAVHLHPDVEAGDTAVATYAIDLGALVAGDPRVPRVYRQPADFFAATHLTAGLRRLLEDVLRGLAGGVGDRVLQLRSPFGGGKSHTLATLYHAARSRAALNAWPEGKALPDPGPVRVAVFDGEKFDVQGQRINGQPVQTLWGALAAQLGGYDLLAYHDQKRVAPGGDRIAELLGQSPTLILLDELLQYLERALAERVQDSTLGRQTQDFLQSLSVEVARAPHAVLVYSLQASAHEAYGNEALLKQIDHLTSRVDAKREPVTGDEILSVLRRRLLAEPPDPRAAQNAAEVYANEITRARSAHALDESARRAAEDDRLVLRDRILAAYPFHPALIDVMIERWASLPDFQRTRGALRFLSVCLHTVKRLNLAGALLGPGDIPLQESDVAQAFFTEVGQREPFKAVLQRDFLGSNASAGRIDERLALERPNLSGVNPAMRIATAILAYSFGGRSHAGAEGGEPIASGVSENELMPALVGPELDGLTVQAVLKDLREQCLFLDYDGVHYAFKTTATVNQALEEQAARVRSEEIDAAIEAELRNRLAGRTAAIIWPKQSADIPDREPRFLLAYLPLDVAMQGDAGLRQQALALLMQHGDRPRVYRNGLGLAVPERSQVEPLRRAMRYLKAIELVRGKKAALNLTTAQMQQIKEREGTEQTALESALRNLYQCVWLPASEQEQVEIDKVSLAGRPLQAQGVQERLLELLIQVPPPRLFTSLTPEKLVQLISQGEHPNLACAISKVVESFYTILSFPRLESEAVLLKAVVQGVREIKFGYAPPAAQDEVKQVREQGGYLVSSDVVRIGVDIPSDQIDLSAGSLVLPQAIRRSVVVTPPPATAAATAPTPSVTTTSMSPTATLATETHAPHQTSVRLRMRMTRSQLYHSVQAIANLAEAAGVIQVTVEAQKLDGFDPAWLRNAVREPLDEADVQVEDV